MGHYVCIVIKINYFTLYNVEGFLFTMYKFTRLIEELEIAKLKFK